MVRNASIRFEPFFFTLGLISEDGVFTNLGLLLSFYKLVKRPFLVGEDFVPAGFREAD